ncbi:DUF3320 domain-containing protein [Sulfuriroseicoccus oceanibius]|uniref:DUF3320 domain-containing protein n=1 Tax=Sulfuriroseicoccus oceanibius TaxID=2707525 RepID=A0A6B3L9Z1_9BACT|nr:DUF3320 domain-containing protein [Sulfuriroseicoccus oceanibius]QQL43714.1 DUF3320 domain-containing protein [Sulfuriroseicoccus oceanibius]
MNTSLEITATVAKKVGFASHQNSVPLLLELDLENKGEEVMEDLVIVLKSDLGFLETKIWRVDRIEPGSRIRLPERDVKLNAGMLADLTEGVSGDVVIEVCKEDVDGEKVASESYPVELLAKTHWGGTASMPELLPAFCMPNDPAIDKVLKMASDTLRRAGKNDSINGYEDRSRSRVWEITSAIWSAVAGLQLSYSLPPASFETSGQKVRTPGAILEGRLATCLDSSMLFAAALEQASLNPLIVITEGHAFVGVWLQPQEFTQLTIEEAMAVRKRVELKEILVFETTLVTKSPTPPFSKAVKHAEAKLNDDEFHMAIDIRRARMRRIKPLGLASPIAKQAEHVEKQEISDALEEAPVLPPIDIEITTTAETPDDRITQWQRKLLDLTARNRLLHLPPNSKHIPLTCPAPGTLEDMLAAGKSIKISATPDLSAGGRDVELYGQQNNEDLTKQYALDALASREVLSPLPAKKLEASLIDLYRKANSDLAEGGANTLFLALGFLNWKKSAEDPRTYRAPLILYPVTLTRRSALSGVVMTSHEDEPRFNLTLLELLRQDFDLHIPGLDGDLPEDASGIDVEGIWNHVRVAVKDIAGFEVTTDTAIGTFSFAKYLMWKDLVDRREQLLENPVVKHLIERGQEGFEGNSEYPKEHELDEKVDPSSLFAPLPADSSQLAAVVASGQGSHFVLDGPPGTGKSQTIANMIVHNISQGRRVLFVAEKMAALEVVYRRLEERGLGDFCLEVHSNNTSKMEILQQLDRAWEVRGDLSQSKWDAETTRLRTLRDRLNKVSQCLHERHPNGMSVHQAIGIVARDHSSATPALKWHAGTVHDRDTFDQMREVARRLDLNLESFSACPADFSIITHKEWSNQWQESVLSHAQRLPQKAENLRGARDKVLASCNLKLEANDHEATSKLLDFIKTVLLTYEWDLNFAFSPDINKKSAAIDELIPLLDEYQRLLKNLSVPYSADAPAKVNIEQIESAWNEAQGKFLILALFAKKKVAKQLAQAGGCSGVPDVPSDLPHLRRLREIHLKVSGLDKLLNDVPGFNLLKSDTKQLAEALKLSTALRGKLSSLATEPDEYVDLSSATRRIVVDANMMLSPEGSISQATARLAQALEEYSIAFDQFTTLCGIANDEIPSFDALDQSCSAITDNEHKLKSWCTWQRVRQDALSLGLQPLIVAAENGSLPKGEVEPSFLAAYSKWFAAQSIDREPILRDFVAVEHMDSIDEFRKIDDEVARLSIEYTRTVLAGRLPSKTEVGKKDGYGILKHELQKKRRHKPLRQLASEMGSAFGYLAPCMLMSPLSIAQYLPADQELFDLVIFDEASQIAPWDAVGSIARGKQVIVAGDPKQMPPTNFFQRASGDSDFDGSVEDDMESILDECLAVGIPRHSLSWHYRSRHESLIAFSNHQYYGGNLITFPAAETRESAVTWRRVDGVYAKGKARTNQDEAKAIVAEVVRLLTDPEFVAADYSLGVITLNADQQRLIEDLLDDARRKQPEIEPFFSPDRTEPVVVKNLETVQGDERDFILLSIGYGPTEPGSPTMSMNFGPLNRDGGERRLNVALTRSRREMKVFTSFDPSMIDLNRTSARAVKDLKHFLEFAERGPRALAEAVKGSVGGYDSPFEEAVARRLEEKGWQIVPQVGVSRFRIDLGIVHPDRPGDFLVGVECDGATYHSAATARDRDKVRASVLEGLGWKLLRVWSTDWFVNQEAEIERLDTAIRELLEADKLKTESKILEFRDTNAFDTTDTEQPEELLPLKKIACNAVDTIPAEESPVTTKTTTPQESQTIARPVEYVVTDFAAFESKLDPELFHDELYTPVLKELIEHTLKTEAPIADDLLVNRIARVHGFKRSGRLIRERIFSIVDEHFHTSSDGDSSSFIWIDEASKASLSSPRVPVCEDSTRKIEHIAPEEILLASKHIQGDDQAYEISRLFGVRRLSSNGRECIERALSSN